MSNELTEERKKEGQIDVAGILYDAHENHENI